MHRLTVPSTLAGALAATLTLSACGKDQSREDASDSRNVDKTAPKVIAFNNNYPNVETKCDGAGHRLFVTTSKTVIVLPDPTCPGFVRGQEPTVVEGR